MTPRAPLTPPPPCATQGGAGAGAVGRGGGGGGGGREQGDVGLVNERSPPLLQHLVLESRERRRLPDPASRQASRDWLRRPMAGTRPDRLASNRCTPGPGK